MKNEIRGWTALRALAALWVVAYHFGIHFKISFPGHWIHFGFLGVDVFFMLSGAVLYYVYAQSLAVGEFSYRDFLWKRFARIYPVHLVSLLIALVIFVALPLVGVGKFPDYDIAGALFVNLALLQSWNLTPVLTLNYPSWSISAEFFAYLLYPVLAGLVLRLPPRLAIWLSVSGFVLNIYALRCFMGDDFQSVLHWTVYFSATRIIPEFFFGLSIARFVLSGGLSPSHPSKSWAVFLVSLTAIATSLHQGIPTVFILASGGLIAALMVIPLPIPRPIHYLGLISYSVYMTHALVFMAGFRIKKFVGGASDYQPLWFLGIMLVAVPVVGSLMYHFVELPGRTAILKSFAQGNRKNSAERTSNANT